MYKQPGDENRPVGSFEKHLCKLNHFFQRPKTETSEGDDVWYVNCPRKHSIFIDENHLNEG